jgi:hypothetical protein
MICLSDERVSIASMHRLLTGLAAHLEEGATESRSGLEWCIKRLTLQIRCMNL